MEKKIHNYVYCVEKHLINICFKKSLYVITFHTCVHGGDDVMCTLNIQYCSSI